MFKETFEQYFSDPNQLRIYLRGMDKDELISELSDIVDFYANDLNSSTIRHLATLWKAGYIPEDGKLGYAGESPQGKPCLVKTMNISNRSVNSTRKLDGGGSFSDLTHERFDKLIEADANVLVSGFCHGRLMYVFEFPLDFIRDVIDQRLAQLPEPHEPNEYARSSKFNYSDYGNNPEIGVKYISPDIAGYAPYFRLEFYQYLTELYGS